MKAFTIFHVALSLAGIVSGWVVVFGLLAAKQLNSWTTFFLATTAATSLSGFLFPVRRFMPSHGVGILSVIVLAFAIYARYARDLIGPWCKVYVVGAVVALYLNVFVGIVQAFLKVPALNAMAPTQSEPPFKLTQLVVLLLFIALGVAAVKKFRVDPLSPTLEANMIQPRSTGGVSA